jgi:oxygen-independent coproporphyrinogen-3 oxidase
MTDAALSPSMSATSPGALAQPPTAMYVHVPFCVSLCPYCDFVVLAGSAARGPRSRIAAFVDALLREIDLRGEQCAERFGDVRPALDSLYLGGGTPSLLPPDDVAAIVARVRERFGMAADAEVTLEANPGPDERGDPRAWRAAGITRLSFGAQSLDADALRRLGRRHALGDVADAVAAARAAQMPSVNLDLLYDVPEQPLATWMATLDVALDLAPDHLSLYALTLDDPDAEGLTGPLGDHLPTTSGARRWRVEARAAQDEDRAAAAYHHAALTLSDEGYRGYEISNWARPGHESRHNLAYWSRRPHEAVGPGAHAFDGVERRWNAARLDPYLAALGDGRLPPGGADVVDTDAVAAEATILALRLDTGVSLADAYQPPLGEHLGWAIAAELVDVTEDDRVVLTTRGRLLSNELFARLV